jgi:hypothetical protein
MSHCSNVMVWGSADTGLPEDYRLTPGLDDFLATLHEGGGGPGGVESLLQRLAREVFREYQRGLWDPEAPAGRVGGVTRHKRWSRSTS